MLRKDPGAHFTYNLGVSFFRAGIFLLFIAAVIFGCSFIKRGNRLEYNGDCEVYIKGIWRDNANPIPLLDLVFPAMSYYAYVQLRYPGSGYEEYDNYEKYGEYDEYGNYYENDYNDGYEDFNDIKIFISKESFDKMLDYGLDRGGLVMHDYRTETSGTYISFLEKNAAEKEYAKVNPKNGLRYLSLIVLMIALPVLWIGRHEEALGMKYPRSDVPVELSGSLVPVEEFCSFSGTAPAPAESALFLTDGGGAAADESSAP
jgi:hypothetical protein